jgi:hypothetical protein
MNGKWGAVRALTVLGLALAVGLSTGCQLIGGSSRSDDTRGEPRLGFGGTVYHGELELDGGEVPAALEIAHQGGREVLVALQTTSGLEADGTGEVRRGTLTVTLQYGGDCPGRITLEGPWDEEGGVFSGTASAVDCTGRAEGTFWFGYRFP